MDANALERMIKLMTIFQPYATERRLALQKSKKRVVHYTSAENVFKIVSSKTMWMRNTNCMSDYSEVEHGYQMLHQFFAEQERGQGFLAALNACFPGLGEETIKLFDRWWTEIRFNTYICSISEHEDSEDGHGRLSMWRAFGQNTTARAALVMSPPELGEAEGLRVLLSPVAYFGYAEVEEQFSNVFENINANLEFLRTFGKDHLQSLMFFTLVSAAVSLKHIGYQEEREWRVIYLPKANPSTLITSSTEIVAGVPQIVYKIPLEEHPEQDVAGVGIPRLVDRIIIGPTVYAAPMRMAFVEALRHAGLPDPHTRVVVSGIPIRS